MSALRPKADMCSALGDVRFVPIADIARYKNASRLVPSLCRRGNYRRTRPIFRKDVYD